MLPALHRLERSSWSLIGLNASMPRIIAASISTCAPLLRCAAVDPKGSAAPDDDSERQGSVETAPGPGRPTSTSRSREDTSTGHREPKKRAPPGLGSLKDNAISHNLDFRVHGDLSSLDGMVAEMGRRQDHYMELLLAQARIETKKRAPLREPLLDVLEKSLKD